MHTKEIVNAKIMNRKDKFEFLIFPSENYFLRNFPGPHHKLCSANDKVLRLRLALKFCVE